MAYRPTTAPDPLGHAALYGGVIVYLIGDQLIWQRARGRTSRRRMLGMLLVALSTPATALLPGLGALVLLTAVGIGLATTTPFPATRARRGGR
ncbi:low temperature requirement protein A [Micromonospora coerulea]|uniref:low temperature requirement protein A n=1 Tax=Micromonospora coerulea TaxID=47856 RepID=UPI00190843BE|nr:low temperature requirement protein A [Micromonospora veneta]